MSDVIDMGSMGPGAPLQPTGNPMLSNMGPASYANRANVPDTTIHGLPRIVPLRAAPGFHLDPKCPDPRGMTVIGGDKAVAGQVVDVWVDRAEPAVRYYEVALAGDQPPVLLPFTCTRIIASKGQVLVKSIFANQFTDVPRTASPEQVTFLEEDKILAYYASGYMYASPQRGEPFL